MSADCVITGTRIVRPDGVGPGCVIIRAGVITEVGETLEPQTDIPRRAWVDAGDAVVIPGAVDTHVHFNDPGRAAWEGFDTGTKAAAAGGITTIVDMPLNSIPATTTVEALDAKRDAARGRCWVDYGFWGGVVPGNTSDLEGLIDAGALGFKCFLTPSGVDEFDNAGEADLRAAAPIIARLGVPLLVHAEDPVVVARAPHIPEGSERSYAAYLATRPREAEHRAIEMIIRLAEEFGFRSHIVHLASADAIDMLRAARERGVPISVETCPHYLSFASEDLADGQTQFKCAPPIRELENRERLWEGLREGVIDLVASDHSPSPPAGKCMDTGDFARAWGGIASVQVSVPAVWTGASQRGFTLVDLARWMCEHPAHLAGLGHRKGKLAPGYDGDLVIWRPEAHFVVRGASLRHRHSVTAYEGLALRGVVDRTIIRGVDVYRAGRFPEEPLGQWIRRAPA